LPVSGFNPVLIECSLGFVALNLRFGSIGPGTAERKPIGGSRLRGLLPFGLLALGSKVDDVAHPETQW
jgi:hypothetical protein